MNRPNDEQNPQLPPRPTLSQGLRFKLAAVALMLVSALFATGLALRFKPQPPQPNTGMAIPARLFQNWGKPDFVVLLSAQQHGYMLPCGCSRPQKGGLERRYNFMQLLKARGWPVVAVDLGEVPQTEGPAKLPNVQGLLKYTYSMKALKEMSYLGVGLGRNEASLSLGTILGEWALNEDTPAVLVANLANAANFPGFKPLAIQTVSGSNLKVGVTNLIGKTIAAKIAGSRRAIRGDPSGGRGSLEGNGPAEGGPAAVALSRPRDGGSVGDQVRQAFPPVPHCPVPE